jgi:CRP/FNR family transcriptional regulator, cyclic AMP receptor protein
VSSDKNLADQLSFFQKVSLFQGLSEGQLKKIIPIMHEAEIESGNLITQEGANEDTVFILLKGEVEISKRLLMPLVEGMSDKQEKSLVRLSEKDHAFFGEMALFEEKPERSASITALKNSKVAILNKNEFLDILEQNPEIGFIVIRNISTELTRRLVKANKDILKLTTAFSLALEGE